MISDAVLLCFSFCHAETKLPRQKYALSQHYETPSVCSYRQNEA
ncbi:hypothetical protein B4119_2377 [Parageobacillus caldoxylosilyticus]|uniref:Uncharacterized protein n=1 Tax=Saccharococcus caldoxylosilyticus TaxID=81408 RepID=A0A150LVM9_9BACL|nr:hypothetical protein B4119_2377 [Parageobacillus caldoxylosilyticus]